MSPFSWCRYWEDTCCGSKDKRIKRTIRLTGRQKIQPRIVKMKLLVLVALFHVCVVVTAFGSLTPSNDAPINAPVFSIISYTPPDESCSTNATQIQNFLTYCLEDPSTPGHLIYFTCSEGYTISGACSGTCQTNPAGLCPSKCCFGVSFI